MPLHRLEVPAPDVLPFAIGSFDAIGPLSRAPFPHRHTFHEIVHVTRGSGSHVADLDRRPLEPPQLVVLTPGQVHSWEGATGLQGTVLLFDDAFLLAHPGDRERLRLLGERSSLRLRGEAAEDADRLLERMLREHRDQRPGTVSVLQACLHILLVQACRLAGPAPAPPAAPGGRAAALARDFVRLLSRSGGAPVPSVRAAAAELGVTPGYLNEAVKGDTGRTPAQLLRQAQVLEAKRLLAGTGLTVARIAREVGFADPAYFCRFFRRETGLTPGGFRRACPTRPVHHGHRAASIDPRPAAP
jgi:AraC-like DNA-binding protein